jgi:hypothetical protein
MDIVDQTLRRWRQEPFAWGSDDCMLSIGDYIALRGGLDVTGRFRGTYSTVTGAMRHVRRAGGIPGLINLTGIPMVVGEPVRGDVVALYAQDCEGDMIGAICTGSGIAARMVTGVAEIQTRLVRLGGVWRCPL